MFVVHIVCAVDVIANSLVLYLPFCSTLNKNVFFFFFYTHARILGMMFCFVLFDDQ